MAGEVRSWRIVDGGLGICREGVEGRVVAAHVRGRELVNDRHGDEQRGDEEGEGEEDIGEGGRSRARGD